jgi:hypothetical protein
MSEDQCIEVSAAPPNKAIELTSEIVTPFACAKGAPIPAAAHRKR